ncbi:MAG: 16S rRNA (cytosine(1402)-N(4))-methyltransferase RsmH [Hyphomicrobiales bacterium]
MPDHIPVLLDQVLGALVPRDGEHYLDATFGAGGYTRAMLEAARCQVSAIDRDPEAAAIGRAMARHYGGRLAMFHDRFCELEKCLRSVGRDSVDGVIFDIGVSSMQIDRVERGFSFKKDGPLDMRMEGPDADGSSAADIVNSFDEASIGWILRTLGEERKARAIARAIVQARRLVPITTTGQLAAIVARTMNGHFHNRRIHPATRSFQALRLYVNDELGELIRGLSAAERVLRPGGRLVVVAFHSLEDRIVKTFLASRSGRIGHGSRHAPPDPVCKAAPSFTIASHKAGKPDEREVAGNRRARSARLRTAVRTNAPAWPLDPKALGAVRLAREKG